MKIKLNLSNTIFISMFLFLFLNVASMTIKKSHADIAVIFTFAIILILSLTNIYRDKTNFSLNKSYWYFNLIFLFVAPFIQYMSSYNMWGYYLSDKHYLLTNLLIIFSNVVYMLFYGKTVVPLNPDFTIFKKIKIDNYLFGISIFCLLIMVYNVGLINLFSRATNSATLSDNGMFNAIFIHLFKAIPVYCFTFLYLKDGKINFKNFLIGIMILVLNFPTSTTRFWMGAIYIGMFLIILCIDIQKNKRLFDSLLIFTFAVLFSLSFAFKYLDFETFLQKGIEFKDVVDSYNTVDYDAYSYISRSFDYVEKNGIVLGKQVIGTILFIIPRAIWPSKPIATGSLIASSQGQLYVDVSCPYIAEGFVNFGVLGVFLFSLVLSRVCKMMDRNFWQPKFSLIKLSYPYFMGLLIFLLRGALHHAVVYTFCFCIPILFVALIKVFKKRSST